MKKQYLIVFSLVLIISSGSLLSGRKTKIENREVVRKVRQSEMKRILDNRELKVVVDYNSTNYFIYKGRPMGFQYEILKAFANDLGVSLHVVSNNNMDETFEGLNKSKYDLVAKNLIEHHEREKMVDYTEPFAYTRQVLVQKKKTGAKSNVPHTQGAYVTDQFDLAGMKVYVQKGTAHVTRLENLQTEIGGNIEIVEDTVNSAEQLIAKVAAGEIEYTVCDELVAKSNQLIYPWIDVSVPLSFNQKLSWAVRKNSVEWKNYIDQWMAAFKNTSEYDALYSKYFFENRSAFNIRSEYHSRAGGKISEHDAVLRKLAASYGFDWRLIAAMIMEESGFEKEASSWAGALGLMQLMPQTAAKFGVANASDPKQNIRGGLEYLLSLNNIFEPMVANPEERLKFILAAYNVGVGHVIDARNLAMKYGKNPEVWKGNVEEYLLKKSISAFYRDPVVKKGYCRGEVPIAYVNRVMECYQHYLNLLEGDGHVALAGLPTRQLSSR